MSRSRTSAAAYPPSASGYYDVALSRPYDAGGVVLSPAADRIVVDETTLVAMIAAGVVTSVAPA